MFKSLFFGPLHLAADSLFAGLFLEAFFYDFTQSLDALFLAHSLSISFACAVLTLGDFFLLVAPCTALFFRMETRPVPSYFRQCLYLSPVRYGWDGSS